MFFHQIDAFLFRPLLWVDSGSEKVKLTDTKVPEKADCLPLEQFHCPLVLMMDVTAINPISAWCTKGKQRIALRNTLILRHEELAVLTKRKRESLERVTVHEREL